MEITTASVISFFKLLLSKTSRQAFGQAAGWFFSRSILEKDFFVLEAKIKLREREKAQVFLALISEKLSELDFWSDVISDFEIVFKELVGNSFEHGCKKENDSITLRAIIFGVGLSLEVKNNSRRNTIPFNSEEIARKETPDPGKRGRGLPLVFGLVDQFDIASDRTSIKVVMYDAKIRSQFLKESDILVVNVGSYLGNYIQKIEAALAGARAENVVLVFSLHSAQISSSAMAAGAVESSEIVKRFSIAIDNRFHRFLSDIASHFEKFEGFYTTAEAAISAMTRTSKEKRKKKPKS